MWSFSRLRDRIETAALTWHGPFCWPGYGKKDNLLSLPDLGGVYLFTFPYKDGYSLYCAGITNSTKRRILQHTYAYKKGKYTVLNVEYALRSCERESPRSEGTPSRL